MKEIPRREFSLEHLRDAITFTKLLSRSSNDLALRYRSKMAIAYCEMMDVIEPSWREVAVEAIRTGYKEEIVNLREVFLDMTHINLKLSLNDFVINDTKGKPKHGTSDKRIRGSSSTTQR